MCHIEVTNSVSGLRPHLLKQSHISASLVPVFANLGVGQSRLSITAIATKCQDCRFPVVLLELAVPITVMLQIENENLPTMELTTKNHKQQQTCHLYHYALPLNNVTSRVERVILKMYSIKVTN